MRFPASHSSFRIRYSLFDVIWAAASPLIALYLRNVTISTDASLFAAELYCTIAFAAALLAFLIFRIREGIAHHFSAHDALEVAKAVGLAELLTTLAIFTIVRMDGIPRSTPIIHALILAAGLVGYRALIRMLHEDDFQQVDLADARAEHIVMIGSTRLSSLYARMMTAYSPRKYKIVAIFDDDPSLIGKSVDGVRVVGPPEQLGSIVQEFAEHGIVIDRVLAGGDKNMLSPDKLAEIERICADYNLTLEFIASLVGLDRVQERKPDQTEKPIKPELAIELPAYFRYKRVADVVLGLAFLVTVLPIIVVIAGMVLLDVGSPVLFWQQRIGLGGRPFLLHKFRTLKPLFNERGLPIGTSDRVSWIGLLLRKTRLDEIPQLLNVVVGDMSLVGPRPLLPQDQPVDTNIRLAVRPGLTGWAQINGGKSLTAAEKNELDEWYVRNASFLLDLKVLFMTIGFVLKGEQPIAPQPAQGAEIEAKGAEMELTP